MNKYELSNYKGMLQKLVERNYIVEICKNFDLIRKPSNYELSTKIEVREQPSNEKCCGKHENCSKQHEPQQQSKKFPHPLNIMFMVLTGTTIILSSRVFDTLHVAGLIVALFIGMYVAHISNKKK